MSVGGEDVQDTISKIEDTLRFRRKNNLYDVDKTSKLVENEVSRLGAVAP